jgi:hypothetical protein
MSEAKQIGDVVSLVYPVLGNLAGTKVEIVEVMNDGEPHELRGYLYRVKSTVNEKVFLQWESMIA